MRIQSLIVLLPLMSATAVQAQTPTTSAPPPTVTPVMTKALPDYPGKEVLILEVAYPPGGADPVHRHDAHGFVYVLEGSVVMGVQGVKRVTWALTDVTVPKSGMAVLASLNLTAGMAEEA